MPACSAYWLKAHGGHAADADGHGGMADGHGDHAPPAPEPETFKINGNGQARLAAGPTSSAGPSTAGRG